MSDNRRTKVVAVALAVTLVASVFAGGAIVAAQTDGNETGNETATEADAGMNETETEADAGMNETETEADAGMNETETETDAGMNETENETDAGMNETETETEAGANETDDEDEEEPEAESDVGIIADDDDEADNETDARGDAAANETTDEMDTQQTTYLRVVHGAPDVDAVDVSVDNETVLEEVPYGAVSDYLTLQAGEYNVTVTTSEDDEVVYSEDVTLDPRTVTTFAATSGEMTDDEDEADEGVVNDSDDETPELEAATFNDNAYQPEDGEAAVSVVHLSPDAGNVDVTVEGSDVVLADNLSYQNASDYVTVPEGDYTVEVRMEGDEEGSNILETFDVTVEGGTAYSAIALGYDQPPSDSQRSLNLTAAEDATTTVNLPGEDANETAMNETAMNETENETDAGVNETETETETETDAGLNETETETETETDAGLNETETETETETDAGLNETETETDVGLDETETETDDGNLTVGDDTETEANETGNDTLLLAP
ncbi:DUF4397 domain-containing protein [Halobacteria archaeon HArc-gm2]|nr:DUF4397 domain-containing protein [Halobacteria archaeon HArc-gm2]